ncbi:MAG TPA: hypothetical protein VJI46_03145 [Candidatus Nanoarchaeia archaeon]|nr:hypothetical protein [Candidatus Nanoarchaeia archaeon]
MEQRFKGSKDWLESKISELLIVLANSETGFLEDVHNGSMETSYKAFFPHLQFRELLVMVADSRRQREAIKGENERDEWVRRINSSSAYDIAKLPNHGPVKIGNKEYGNLYHWFIGREKYVHDKLPSRIYSLIEKLNPFPNGQNLGERMARVPQEAVEELKENLKKPARRYVSESAYREQMMMRRGDNSRIEYLPGLPEFNGKRAEFFANAIAKIVVESYGMGYVPLGRKPEQLKLLFA